MLKTWRRLFLEDRPTTLLGLFRIAVAATTGLHVIPTFFQLEDNYLATAFKEKNLSFFTQPVIDWVDKSPDGVVLAFVALFCAACFLFLIGFLTQLSGILMMLSCYYFYALNSLHIGTLSWDILLVTLFLMVVTPYPGGALSVDAALRKDFWGVKRPKPFFVQRLLQFQMASTFFYTALGKISPHGNWLTANPFWYLMNEPEGSVVKEFALRPFLAGQEALCYWIGLSVIAVEMTLPMLWFIRRTRAWAVAVGWFFHVLLVWTLHVPTIFLFLFPPQMLLFLDARWLRPPRSSASP